MKEEQPLRPCLSRLAASLVALVWIATAAEAQTQTTISMDVTEAYLEDVLKVLSRQSGMNFVAGEKIGEKKVTLYFDRVPIADALDSILRANGLSLLPKGGKNLYLVTPSGAPEIATITQVFRLKYARVQPTAGESAANFGLSGSLIKELLGEEGAGSSVSTSASTGTGQPSGPLSIVRALLTEHGSVVPDPRTNSLIVTDIPERVRVVEETLAKLDVKPKQIYIEAEVLEVTLDTLRRIGLEYGTSTGQIGSWVGPKRTTFFPFSLGLLDGATKSTSLGTLSFTDANVLFKLIATDKDVKFLARPRLLTLSNEVAEIRIVAEAVTGVTSSSQSQTGTITEEPERTTVGTILRVTPMVNDDNFVTMIIEPEVSRVITSSFNTKFQDPNRRLARTTVMVQNAGTAMIAGLISSEHSDGARRIPGLGDIPLLGIPFKRTELEQKNTEIVLFITPHIVPDNEQELDRLFAKEREQAPLSVQEKRLLEGDRKRILKERAITQTIESLAW